MKFVHIYELELEMAVLPKQSGSDLLIFRTSFQTKKYEEFAVKSGEKSLITNYFM